MPTQSGWRHVLASLLLAALGSFSAFSQTTALLRGTITDPQGAVIADAKVTLSSANIGFNRSVITSSNGEYQFLQMSPGTYTVMVEAPGFSTLTRTGVQLLVNTPT